MQFHRYQAIKFFHRIHRLTYVMTYIALRRAEAFIDDGSDLFCPPISFHAPPPPPPRAHAIFFT